MCNKIPVKGQPDFTMLSDSLVRTYRDLATAMIGSYADFPEVTQVLTQIWEDLTNEYADRISQDIAEKPVLNFSAKRRLKNFRKNFSKNS